MREASKTKAITQRENGSGPTYRTDTSSSVSRIDHSTGTGSRSAMVRPENFPRALPRALLESFQARGATGLSLACSGQPVIIERRERANCKLARERPTGASSPAFGDKFAVDPRSATRTI